MKLLAKFSDSRSNMEWGKRMHKHSTVVKIFVGLVALYLLIMGLRSLYHSLSFLRRDRITMVVYGSSPVVLSLGLSDNVSYILFFDNSMMVNAVGGYGEYKIGSIQKLAKLSGDGDLLRRTFSSILSSHVDYYFAPKKNEVYFDTAELKNFSSSKAIYLSTVLNPNYGTNANFLERMYLLGTLFTLRKLDFSLLKTHFVTIQDGNQIFDEDDFFHYYQGFFYEKSLRDERDEIKIIYKRSTSAAKNVSRILEGEGIRIVDLDRQDSSQKKCEVQIDPESMIKSKVPKSAQFIIDVFGCDVKVARVDGATILFYMGEKVEGDYQ